MNPPEIGSTWKFKKELWEKHDALKNMVVHILRVEKEDVYCYIENGVIGPSDKESKCSIQELYEECDRLEPLAISKLRKKLEVLKNNL
jgi:hypothetical protein